MLYYLQTHTIFANSISNKKFEIKLLREIRIVTLKKSNIAIVALICLAGLMSITSCSTKKNTWTRRAFHNVNCKYNVYWNGNNALNEGDRNMKENVVNNYNEILRVYNYGTKQDAQKLNPKMDRAIKKASIGIQKHSMYFGGEEKVKYVRNSYLMMGKAHFYKHDFISARRVFDYVAKEYGKDPISNEAYLWLAKTHIESERFEKAEATLNLLYSKLESSYVQQSVRRDLPMVQADFYLVQQNYYEPYAYLERGIELGNERDVVTRALFILGQINQLEGDLDLATDYYQKVVKRNPEYIMAFEARMSIAECYDEGTGDSKNINKVLRKMAKDFRNKEFLDQIYFALADVALKDGDVDLTIEYLQKSVSSSIKDNYQKSTSALKLADIYFQRADYLPAEAYYDTAVTFLPPDFPNYDLIKNKASVLSEIVVHSQTIHLQDSLQRLASMDTTQLLALIDEIIEDYQINQVRMAEEAEEALEQGVQFVNVGNDRSNQRLGGQWYFYNPQAMNVGRSEFKQKWGNRKLEDNWRLSDKRLLMQSYDEEVVGAGGVIPNDTLQTADALPSDPETREYYLADLPKTEADFQASYEKEIEAYKKLGFLYLEELNDTAIALETYLDFRQKYPENKYRLESLYALYKIYNEQGNDDRAAHYKSLIISSYPESDYARVIMDPDYYIKLSQQKGQSAKLYERAYKAYENGQYYRVITYADRAIEQYPADTALLPRFLFIRAISLGKVNVPDTLYAALQQLVTDYPRSRVSPRAHSIMKMLQREYGLGDLVSVNVETGEPIAESPFTYDPDDMHLVVMVLNSELVEIDPLKVRMSDFKKKYFRLVRLRVKSLMLDKQRAVLTIGNFENSIGAYDFYTAIEHDEYVLSGMSTQDYELFAISTSNYPILYREKNVEAYQEFFKEYYLDKK